MTSLFQTSIITVLTADEWSERSEHYALVFLTIRFGQFSDTLLFRTTLDKDLVTSRTSYGLRQIFFLKLTPLVLT